MAASMHAFESTAIAAGAAALLCVFRLCNRALRHPIPRRRGTPPSAGRRDSSNHPSAHHGAGAVASARAVPAARPTAAGGAAARATAVRLPPPALHSPLALALSPPCPPRPYVSHASYVCVPTRKQKRQKRRMWVAAPQPLHLPHPRHLRLCRRAEHHPGHPRQLHQFSGSRSPQPARRLDRALVKMDEALGGGGRGGRTSTTR
jgi:hypothetical protein